MHSPETLYSPVTAAKSVAKARPDPSSEQALDVKEAFDRFIMGQEHPCVMARAAFKNDQVVFNTFDQMLDPGTTRGLLQGLQRYVEGYEERDSKFYSFLVAFPKETVRSEEEFEEKLWALLQRLHEADGSPWDQAVSKDPRRNDFSFSLCGTAFYIVGMHPLSSRKARRAPFPAIAFNLHKQFEHLREMGVYDQVKQKIRERDKAFQGSINPMVEDFGDDSEAKQYSGRAVGEKWKCPFHAD